MTANWTRTTIAGVSLIGLVVLSIAVVLATDDNDPAPAPGPEPPPPLQVAVDSQVATLAGVPSPVVGSFADGAAATARFYSPESVAVDSEGNVYVADLMNHRIRKISPGGLVETLAGTGEPGLKDGPALQAQFNAPAAVAMDREGAVYVSDAGNNRIRKITPEGLVVTIAGSGPGGLGDGGFADGAANSARFANPVGLVVMGDGTIFVADKDNQRIRQISPDGTVGTLAGSGEIGVIDATGEKAAFSFPVGLALAPGGGLFVTDQKAGSIRHVSMDGTVTTVVAPGTLHFPAGLAVTRTGELLVADTGHNQVHRVSAEGAVTALAGTGTQGFSDGRGATASLFNPTGLAELPDGRIVIADSGSNTIRILALQ